MLYFSIEEDSLFFARELTFHLIYSNLASKLERVL